MFMLTHTFQDSEITPKQMFTAILGEITTPAPTQTFDPSVDPVNPTTTPNDGGGTGDGGGDEDGDEDGPGDGDGDGPGNGTGTGSGLGMIASLFNWESEDIPLAIAKDIEYLSREELASMFNAIKDQQKKI